MKKMLLKNLMVLGVSIVAGFMLLLLVHLLPTEKMQENVYWSKDTILAEFEEQLVIDGYEPTMTGSFTDCLMLQHAIYHSGEHSALEQAMSMYRSESCPEGGDAWWAGQSLIDYLDGVKQPKEAQYPRYWHGYLVVLKPLLMLTSLNGLRMLGAMLLTTLVGVVLMVCGYQKKTGLGIAIVAALPFMFYGTSFMSLSLSICVYLALGAVLAVLLSKKAESFPILFLLIGIMTAYFDFLTFPLVTLGFPLCAAVYGRECEAKEQWKRAAVCFMEWGIGYAVMWGGKWVLADLFTQTNTVKDAFRTMFTRAGSAQGQGRFSGFFEVLYSNLSPYLNIAFALFALGIAVCLLLFLFRRNIARTQNRLQNASVFLCIALLPFAWWFVMQNHSQEHWAYTCRNFAVVILAVILAVVELMPKRMKD